MSETIRVQQRQPDGTWSTVGGEVVIPSTVTPPPVGPTYGMNPARIVVAPGGSDTASGTDASPFATIDRALTAWSSAPDHWIYVRGGVHEAQNAHYGRVTVTPTKTLPLVVRNWPGETPTFPGGAAGNFMLECSNGTNEARCAYLWVHGLLLDGLDDPSGNGRIVEMADTPGPFRVTGMLVRSRGSDFHDHGLYLGRNVNKSGLPSLVGGNALGMGVGEGWGVHCYSDSQPTVRALEVAWNISTGGSGLALLTGVDGVHVHHNSHAGGTRGAGISVGEYSPITAKNVETDHNTVDHPLPYYVLPASIGPTVVEHDNWFHPGTSPGCGPAGAPRMVTAGPEFTNGAFAW